MSQNHSQESNHSQNMPLNQHIKQPLFTVKKEDDAYEITLQLNPSFSKYFSHFSVHYLYANKTINYKNPIVKGNQFQLLIPISELILQAKDSQKELVEFYFTIQHSSDENELLEQELPISLAQFEQLDTFGLTQTIYQGQSLIPYFSQTEELFGIALNLPVPNTLYFEKHQIESVDTSKNTLSLQGNIATKAFTLREAAIVFIGRESGKEMFLSTNHTTKDVEVRSALHHYDYSFAVDLQKFVQELLIEGIHDDDFDFYLEVYLNGLYQPIRIPLSINGLTLPKKAIPISYGKSTVAIGLNSEGPLHAISLALSKYKKEIYTYYRERLPLLLFKAPLHRPKNIWVIGEKPMEARDNGWAFFCYMRRQHPEQPVYYVIDEQSPDYQKAAAFDADHLLLFKSKKYLDTLFAANVLLFTETPHALYPSRSPMPLNVLPPKMILLQKQVLGLEDVRGSLGYSTRSFPIDLALASSKTEERFLQQTLEYPENKIRLTGLARFDQLLGEVNKAENPAHITFYPQEYQFGHYLSKESMRKTAEEYLTVVQSHPFAEYLKQHSLNVLVVLPKTLADYVPLFQQAGCLVELQGKAEPVSILKQSRLFVTDAHPLAFDASFKGIPVLFYQPEAAFQKSVLSSTLRHTYMNELPGEIVSSQDSLMYMMEEIASQEFKQSRKNRQKADALLHYPDTQASERIFDAVTAYLR